MIRNGAGEVTFHRPDGALISKAPNTPTLRDGWPEHAPGNVGSIPVWDGTPFDVAWAIDVLRGGSAVSRNQEEDEEEGCGSCGNRSEVSKELVGALPA